MWKKNWGVWIVSEDIVRARKSLILLNYMSSFSWQWIEFVLIVLFSLVASLSESDKYWSKSPLTYCVQCAYLMLATVSTNFSAKCLAFVMSGVSIMLTMHMASISWTDLFECYSLPLQQHHWGAPIPLLTDTLKLDRWRCNVEFILTNCLVEIDLWPTSRHG